MENLGFKGLTETEVQLARKKFGANQLHTKKEGGLAYFLKSILAEPMVVLLLVGASIYFITGNFSDGAFMVGAIILVIAISLYQDRRSKNALKTLRELTQPKAKVIRNHALVEIPKEEIVMGDLVMVEEGISIPADGVILQSNDFSVNESILTGESLPVFKSENNESQVFFGTTVTSGLSIFRVTRIGNHTRLGQIGKEMEDIRETQTPLQAQISNFVKKMALLGVFVFLLVWGLNYMDSRDFLDSLLKALTLAMSILPEEIPVAFSTFMALGAWRLLKLGVLAKHVIIVETLGSATIICIDKTGTITQNKMSIAEVYTQASGRSQDLLDADEAEWKMLRIAMWASEPIPFDPMEIALHEWYQQNCTKDERPEYRMVHEYPLGGRPPMMTHIFENRSGNRIIAAKGAPEAIFAVCTIPEKDLVMAREALHRMTQAGYRVLGVGTVSNFDSWDFPAKQQDFEFEFLGLVAFYDPPKENIGEVIQGFYQAGIGVKILTGDNAVTATTIANQVGFEQGGPVVDGEQLMGWTDQEVKDSLRHAHLFARMFPEAKLRIINALKEMQQVVAMTGDGVNDGPALKAAHIGIAMGKKGTEIAKQAASMVLMHDDLSSMLEAIAMGRKIYSNLKKAIQYIISIHIPIILTVFIPLVLGWIYPNIFTPIHVIFLELIMGPTCSIIYENEPMEKNTMVQKPRPISSTFFNWKELNTSIVQGLVISAGVLTVYQWAVWQGGTEDSVRTLVFFTLISANIFLTLINRSFYYSIITTGRYKNPLVPIIIGLTVLMTILIYKIPFLADLFQFETVSFQWLGISILAGFLSTIWFELVKWQKRLKSA